PMHSHGVWVTLNGEIYNFRSLREELSGYGHRFVTHSDTETIIHAYEEWGTACVERFNGMFAFAIWDTVKQRAFFARDHFGKKPLYFHQYGENLLFGSEIKSLLACTVLNVQIDHAALWDYFAYRYVPAPSTLFKGIRKLMPGSWAIYEAGQLVEHCYYLPPD
ncbi:MAG: asparagine synthetase B, partial [Rhodoferax sp.]|nr:asparagine synthetase B [Rhodoferax sp.]